MYQFAINFFLFPSLLLLSFLTLVLCEEESSAYELQLISRFKRQDGEGVEDESRAVLCDFGSGSSLSECSWSYPVDQHPNVRWNKGQGATAYWLGGPLVDHSLADDKGGYIYFETSYQIVDRVLSSAALESDKTASYRIPMKDDNNNNYGNIKNNNNNNNNSNNTSDIRINDKQSVFKQALLGLSHYNPIIDIPETAHIISQNVTQTGPIGNCIGFFFNIDGLSAEKLRLLVRDTETLENQTLWESRAHTDGQWIKAEVAYTYESHHRIIAEGIAKSATEPERAYRGYVAMDDIQISSIQDTENVCHGHCTFEGGMCGWTNDQENDDFDWKLGRGSDSFFTGPARDFYSFSREYPLGGFLFIDASYPRRPGDKAMLISPIMQATENGPICFKFATHMYGNGIGVLRVKYRSSEGDSKVDKIMWEMSGESGNNWHQAQLPIASSTTYNIIFEGVIGPNYLGNIAIDSISIEHGVCPVSPQTAARKSGDCTFEENMCHWTNPPPHANLDDFDWIRQFSYGNYGPKHDHTKRNANGYFLSLNGDALQPLRGGTSAWIASPQFDSEPNTIKCMSFYYFMYQRVIETGGPSLGGLRVFIRTAGDFGEEILIPVWRLNNHQSLKWRRAQVSLAIKSGPENELKPPKNVYQVIIEGIWGDARVGSIALDDISFYDGQCSVLPVNAAAISGECSFDKSMCGWKNDTHISSIKPSQTAGLISRDSLIAHKNAVSSVRSSLGDLKPLPVQWRSATAKNRPANLQDHTFRAPVGYVFFDVFNQNTLQTPTLRSPKLTGSTGDEGKICLSFWFSGFGRGESTTLNIYSTVTTETPSDADITDASTAASAGGSASASSDKESRSLLWSIQTRFLETRRNLWYYGQVTVNTDTVYQIVIEGVASDGGFAVDDISFYNGTCQTRPREAAVKVKLDE